ncbi:IS110-like element ISMex9 family transposase [Methylorubrum extorquens]|uniref:Transposase IS116/IS110/IS902 family protein n=1 Tax=Methylorubrum extorquens (strain CM4 / NCIMB 13688) TaxID=440085 RepID=B7KYP8_METC4|nr:IS110-like element ISMex9 family transposase [Methylorubrum extorquens]ACK84799.1 transposase IS116/IS110/IS902 family protein [Methylorubrum extorquens CM4]
MDQQHHVGLDVSVKETAICIVDPHGKVVHRATVESHPEVIGQHLIDLGHAYARVGLEAGPLSPWLYAGLVEVGLPAICVETRHMHAALSARINKTDRNDALGIAQMMRVGLFKPVHVKTLASQQRRLLLTSRKLLQRKAYDIESDLRGQLRNFGLKVGVVGAVGFEQRVRDLVLDLPFVAAVVLPLLEARAALRTQLAKLHKMLLEQVRTDPVCRRLMTAPGVGPVVALTYRTCVDNPARFGRSQCVGAHYGLTPRLYQSGETMRVGRISKCGDRMMRAALYEAALVLLTGSRGRWSGLKVWGLAVAKRRGMQKALVAVARKLAIVLHRMWRDGTDFRWSAAATTAA